MKAKNFGMLLLAGLFMFGLQSCDDDDAPNWWLPLPRSFPA